MFLSLFNFQGAPPSFLRRLGEYDNILRSTLSSIFLLLALLSRCFAKQLCNNSMDNLTCQLYFLIKKRGNCLFQPLVRTVKKLEYIWLFCYTDGTKYYCICHPGGVIMPIKIDNKLPAHKHLEAENIFVMPESRAMQQDIRPLRIIILNLMPTKIETETQILRLLSNSPIQVEIDLLQTATHTSKNVSQEHILKFYKFFDDVKDQKYDGLVITGAPVEHLAFEEVDYWDELCDILQWSKTNVYSTFHICWGAQAGLYYHYGIKKYPLEEKMFGVFPHRPLDLYHPLLRGFDDLYYVPHSRHTEIRRGDIAMVKDLQILSYSDMAGIHLVSDMDCRNFYATGHSEYDRDTLAKEYFRDLEKGLSIKLPYNYFPADDTSKKPMITWRGTGSLLFANWLNYFVYQRTPYDLKSL